MREGREKKGRELNAPSLKAPGSACAKNAPSRARVGACSRRSSHKKLSRFLSETVAVATLKLVGQFLVLIFAPF